MQTKVKFRDQLKDFVRQTFDCELGGLPSNRQSKLMARFYVQQIQRVTTPGLIPSDEDDFESCVIDGKDDCGVDFISRGEEGRVLIIQSKFHGQHVKEELTKFIHFCELLKRLHPRTGGSFPKNRKLEEALADVDWDNDSFYMQYITLGQVSAVIRSREEEGPSVDPEGSTLRDRCDIVLYDEQDLNVKLREALSAGEMIAEPVELRFEPDDEGNPWIKLEGERKRTTYVGFVKGTHLANLYEHNRFKLFAMNIRDWVGDSTTNKGIVTTARDRPHEFLFFNNGISSIASSIDEDLDQDKLVCKNFSIINGAQTISSVLLPTNLDSQGLSF